VVIQRREDEPGRLPDPLAACPRLSLLSPKLAAGIGCRRGVPRAEIAAALEETLRENGFAWPDLALLASIDLKADEPGLRELAVACALELRFYPATELETVDVPSPSARVAAVTGSPSVSEAAAIRAAAGPLLAAKKKFPRVTIALALISAPAGGCNLA
jgi:cobalamin biosynthesis protein CbiG